MNGADAPIAAGPDETDDLVQRAIKNLRADGFDRQAEAVELLVAVHALAVRLLNHNVGLTEAYKDLLRGRAPAYREMWALQLGVSDGYRRALEAVLRAESVTEAKQAALDALR